jgi:4-amino-4-deoxy-L-arabinose transferase-like glycosyltransferase
MNSIRFVSHQPAQLPARARLGMVWSAVVMVLSVAAFAVAFPHMDGDAAVYALLAKHMLQSGDWVTLYFQGADWLDKPHFPYWMTAVSFWFFGISDWAYMVPGLLMYALGTLACYGLALQLFDRSVAALSVVLYAATLGLLLGVGDQKAEVYLCTLLPAASYAWLRYADAISWWQSWRYWLLGAVCSACALMTKGIFVLFLLGLGLVVKALVQRDGCSLWRPKWLFASVGVALFTMPELVALYLQFDAQPDKVVFGRTDVSGLRFFFWDSQFGRFLNTGPIKNQEGTPWFYLHNMLWTFLPWVLLGICALVGAFRRAPALWGARREDVKGAQAFLWATFLSTFLLFSATSYQMDYYMAVVFPYLVILCANWWVGAWRKSSHMGASKPQLWLRCQEVLAMLTLAIALILFVVYFAKNIWLAAALATTGLTGLVLLLRRSSYWQRGLAWPCTAVLALFCFSHLLSHDVYKRFEIGRQIALAMADKPVHPVMVYGRALKNLDLFGKAPAMPVYETAALAKALRSASGGLYLVVAQDAAQLQLAALSTLFSTALQIQELQRFDEISQLPQFIHKLSTPVEQLPRQTVLLLLLKLH